MAMTDASLAAMSAHAAVVVVAEHLVKRHASGALAVSDISIAIPRGAIHAIVGATGSGLTTLVSLLSGVEVPDSGRLAIDGRICTFRGARETTFAGIGLVTHRSSLLPALTVAQNVVLGAGSTHGPFLGVRRGRESVRELGHRHGLHVDPDLRVASLSAGQKQQVEILKALHRGARVLLLDDPTASVKDRGSDALFDSLKSLAAGGITVVLASQRPSDAWRVAESFTVIRDGRGAARGRTLDVSEAELTSMMNGVGPCVSGPGDETVMSMPSYRLKVIDVIVRDAVGKVCLDRVSLEIGGSEILGLAAGVGQGQDVLFEVLAGRVAVHAGSVVVNGRGVDAGADASMQAGIVCVPDQQSPVGVAPVHAARETTSADVFVPQVGRRGWLDARVAAPRAREIIKRQRLRHDSTVGPDGPARSSPTPQVVVARLPACEAGIEPDRALRDDLLAWRAAGAAVLVISSDVDALIDLSDRIAVLSGGRLVSHFTASAVSPQRVRDCMSGRDDVAQVDATQASASDFVEAEGSVATGPAAD